MPHTRSVAETLRLVDTAVPRAIEFRHQFHANPELSNTCPLTARAVAARLVELGLEPRTGVGGDGVTVDIEGAAPGPCLAMRADMDALPMLEQTGLPYASRVNGAMHACGHDGHTAILLGVAEVLAASRRMLAGSVRLVFQPAEETIIGAPAMCADGVMDGVDSIIALHGWPGLPLGKLGIWPGPQFAAVATFEIEISGTGAHAAMPHLGVDPIVAGAQLVLALQSIASREVSPIDPFVLTVSQFHAGTAYNIIPPTATIRGTVRAYDAAVRQRMGDRLTAIADGVCAAYRATCEVTYSESMVPLVNDASVAALVAGACTEALGADAVVTSGQPTMGGEDFADYLRYAPGIMARLGLGDVPPVHSPFYDFVDAAIHPGISMFCLAALRILAP